MKAFYDSDSDTTDPVVVVHNHRNKETYSKLFMSFDDLLLMISRGDDLLETIEGRREKKTVKFLSPRHFEVKNEGYLHSYIEVRALYNDMKELALLMLTHESSYLQDLGQQFYNDFNNE